MYIQLSPEAVQTLKSLDRIPDSLAEMPRSIAEELLSFGLAYILALQDVLDVCGQSTQRADDRTTHCARQPSS